jgi:hypothetical protein
VNKIQQADLSDFLKRDVLSDKYLEGFLFLSMFKRVLFR